MNLKEFKAKYQNGMHVITDKDTIRKVVTLMARLPTGEMYSPTVALVSDRKVRLRDRALKCFRGILETEDLPDTFSELLIKFDQYFSHTKIPTEREDFYTYMAFLAKGFISKTHENKNNNS